MHGNNSCKMEMVIEYKHHPALQGQEMMVHEPKEGEMWVPTSIEGSTIIFQGPLLCSSAHLFPSLAPQWMKWRISSGPDITSLDLLFELSGDRQVWFSLTDYVPGNAVHLSTSRATPSSVQMQPPKWGQLTPSLSL